MTTKRKLIVTDPHDLADKLFKIQAEISAFEEPLKALKEKEQVLRLDMLGALKAGRLDTFRDNTIPLTFTRTYRNSLEVVDFEKALGWALENNCAKVDTVKANSVLKGAGALPKGFSQKEMESLSIRTI